MTFSYVLLDEAEKLLLHPHRGAGSEAPSFSKALLVQFKSVGAVKEATPDQLENPPGVGKRLAQTIYDYFHTEA
ncbi:MAG: helix-hairpin-helix domain-containing protein [Oscillospiraceae bacterium]